MTRLTSAASAASPAPRRKLGLPESFARDLDGTASARAPGCRRPLRSTRCAIAGDAGNEKVGFGGRLCATRSVSAAPAHCRRLQALVVEQRDCTAASARVWRKQLPHQAVGLCGLTAGAHERQPACRWLTGGVGHDTHAAVGENEAHPDKASAAVRARTRLGRE